MRYNKKKFTLITKNELKFLLKRMKIRVRQSYEAENFILSSFSMPYNIKNKLDRISRKHKVSRSSIISELVKSLNE